MLDYKQWQAACAKLVPNRDLKGKAPDKKTAAAAFVRRVRPGARGVPEAGTTGAARPGENLGRPPARSQGVFRRHAAPGTATPTSRSSPSPRSSCCPTTPSRSSWGTCTATSARCWTTLDELNRRKILDGFKLRDAKHHLIFLGDFCDRGAYGVEVLYTLLRLKAANARQVHLARGNHEDFNIVSRYGFLGELRYKFGQAANVTKLMRAYDLLPVVIYVGNEARLPADEPRRHGARL